MGLRRVYRAYLDERGHHLVTLARLVASSTIATLVHCAAGKDRTGVAVAMLLDAVGVERSAVVADYTATNDVLEHVVRTLAVAYGHPAKTCYRGLRLTPIGQRTWDPSGREFRAPSARKAALSGSRLDQIS
jgi:hypothetical protein